MRLVNLPNLISLGRLMSVPVITWLIMESRMAAAFWLFVAAGATDAIDGFIAKRFNSRTELGAYLDPLADKALLVSTYVTLGITGLLPGWLVTLVVFRDVLIIGGALLIHTLRQTLTMQPLLISKLNTAAQIALAALVLAGAGLGFAAPDLRTALCVMVTVTTFLSGAAYVVAWGRRTPDMKRKP
ncbi:MAG: CDP-alcohol phosphatidyltransferase family protein [Alphaproteobacteria bacterium]|nr:CDP-alcohol phosphatidyltransferase family protein [Alphaproteobacteria bacterium]